jgi:hypothetical protein
MAPLATSLLILYPVEWDGFVRGGYDAVINYVQRQVSASMPYADSDRTSPNEKIEGESLL